MSQALAGERQVLRPQVPAPERWLVLGHPTPLRQRQSPAVALGEGEIKTHFRVPRLQTPEQRIPSTANSPSPCITVTSRDAFRVRTLRPSAAP